MSWAEFPRCARSMYRQGRQPTGYVPLRFNDQSLRCSEACCVVHAQQSQLWSEIWVLWRTDGQGTLSMKRTLRSKACLTWAPPKQIGLSGICKQELHCRTTTCRGLWPANGTEHRALAKNCSRWGGAVPGWRGTSVSERCSSVRG